MNRAQLTREFQCTGVFTKAQAWIAAELLLLDRRCVLLLTTPKVKR